MNALNPKIDPVPAILNDKGFRLRLAAFIASGVALLLPGLSGAVFGMSHTASVVELAGWFVLVPILIGAAIVVPGVAAQYSRLTDIIAAIVAALALVYACYLVLGAWREVSQISGAANGMVRGMAGNNPYAQNLSSTFGVGVTPGWGLLVMAGGAALMLKQAIRAYKAEGAKHA